MTTTPSDMAFPIVILGAGPAGLACAYQILKANPQRRVVILDRAPYPGGAGGSMKWKGHTLDFGPHAFHTRGGDAEELVRGLFEGMPSDMIEGRKRVSVYLTGKFFKYPLQVREALLKFNPITSFVIITEFLLTSLIHNIVSIPIESFEDWGRKRFGSKLYKMSFGDYTEKVWKTSARDISRRFASEKIQGFSFVNLVRRLLRIGGQVTEPYYQTWIYHRLGSGALYKALAEKITQMGGEILLKANVSQLPKTGHRIHAVRYEHEGAVKELPCTMVVNTIQLSKFIGFLGDDVPFIVRHHANKLGYISLILVYLEFSVEKIGDDNWFYLLDNQFKFNRVTEQKNLSAATMEHGKTVLSFELTCREGDETWAMTDEALLALAKQDCENVPILSAHIDKISDYKVARVPNAYEVYYRGFEHHAEVALGYVQDIENAVTIGRRGLFLQGDMHQAMEMGLEMGALLAGGLPAEGAARDAFIKKHVRYLDAY